MSNNKQHKKRRANAVGKDKWFVLEEMPGYYPMVVASAMNVKRANLFLRSMGIRDRFSKLLTIYKNGVCSLCMPKREFDKIANKIIELLIKRPQWGDAYNKKLSEKQAVLHKETKKLFKINLKPLSNKELFDLYNRYYKCYESLLIFHWLQTCLDLGDNLFSKYLIGYLRDRIKNNKKHSLGEIFSVLTTPTVESNALKEHKNLLKILQYIKGNNKVENYFKNTETRGILENLKKIDDKLDKKLDKHTKMYGWLGYGTMGPGWDKDYFIDILGSLLRQNIKPEKSLKNIQKDKKETIVKQQKICKELNIDLTHRNLFKIARDLVYSKGSRKDSMFFSFSVIENLYREIGRRYYLSLNQVRFFYPYEIKGLLLKDKYNAALLNDRYKFSLHYSIGDYQDDSLLDGKKAKDFLKRFNFIKENIGDVKILHGDCASSGKARGETVKVNMTKDMEKMKQGNILVSVATNPDLVPAIKKAAAIITDVGGITCHAAIISRELGIPCVIGAKIATKVLKDGDLVEVDATHGKVTIIKKQNKF